MNNFQTTQIVNIFKHSSNLVSCLTGKQDSFMKERKRAPGHSGRRWLQERKDQRRWCQGSHSKAKKKREKKYPFTAGSNGTPCPEPDIWKVGLVASSSHSDYAKRGEWYVDSVLWFCLKGRIWKDKKWGETWFCVLKGSFTRDQKR